MPGQSAHGLILSVIVFLPGLRGDCVRLFSAVRSPCWRCSMIRQVLAYSRSEALAIYSALVVAIEEAVILRRDLPAAERGLLPSMTSPALVG